MHTFPFPCRRRAWPAAVLGAWMLLAAGPALAVPCGATMDSPVLHHDATGDDIRDFVARAGRRVLTFVGFSGQGYEDPAAMRAAAARVLDAQDPARVMVNVGATAEGIGAVYEVARERGFATLGIVSSLARDEGVPLSPCVQQVFFVRDASWGGRQPGTGALSPTSAAIVDVSSEIVALGGGDVARDEALAARAAGKPVRFIAADMSHAAARDKARRRGLPEPVDFSGSAHAALAGSGP
jgi:hypothetical protein